MKKKNLKRKMLKIRILLKIEKKINLSKNSHSSTFLLLTPCLGHVWKSIDMNSFEEAEDIQATIHLRCKVMARVSVGSGVFACFGSGFGFQISLDPVSARILDQKKKSAEWALKVIYQKLKYNAVRTVKKLNNATISY